MYLGGISSIQTPPGNPTFVRLDSKNFCLVCKNVLQEAMQTSCGHRICERCIEPMFAGKTQPVPCPAGEEDCLDQCRKNITPDPSGRREIRNLPVYCDFYDSGCGEKLKWKDLADHVKACQYQPVPCPNSGCDQRIPANRKDVHVKEECEYRPEQCQCCKHHVPLKFIQNHVQDECLAVQLTCPYQCGSQAMERSELNKHKETCVMKPRECKFKYVGCSFMGTEEEVTHHMVNDLNKHVETVTVYAARMEVQTLEIRRELQDVQSEKDRLKQQVSNMTHELSTLKTNFEKAVTSNKDLKKDDEVTNNLIERPASVETISKLLKMVSLTERVIHLEKQSETTAKKDVVDRHDRDVRTMQTSLTQVRAQVAQLERISLNEGRSGSGEAAAAVPELKRRIDMHDSQFAQLDVQMAELDLRFQILETASYDGTLMWKLRDYARRKQDAVQGRTLSLYSQPFYTHRYGYKMCARVYLNGDGAGKRSHLSLFFVVMRGEYDNLLPWPFQQKVTMTLLDQENGQCNLSDSFSPDPTSTSFKKPTTDMNIASGCPLFVLHAVLETPKYVKDDIIMIKFQTDLQNLNHP